MSDAAKLIWLDDGIVDGTNFRRLDLLPPKSNTPMTGAQLLAFAESKASGLIFDVPLPPHLKAAGLRHVSSSFSPPAEVTFRSTVLTPDQVSKKLRDYFDAIAEELKDEPLVLRMCNGAVLKPFLEDEDDFAMLSERVFTDLDVKDTGKLPKSEIRNAILLLGIEVGIPPFSDFPQLDDILKKHGVDEEKELGQSQFAEVLQSVLQEIVDVLAENSIVVIDNVKVFNGSKLKKLLANEDQFNTVMEKILQHNQSGQDGQSDVELIRDFLEKNGSKFGVPPKGEFYESETLNCIYDEVFSKAKDDFESMQDDLRKLVKKILLGFSEKLKANPIQMDIVE